MTKRKALIFALLFAAVASSYYDSAGISLTLKLSRWIGDAPY